LEEAENTAENLSAALAGLSVEAGKVTERISILIKQLKEASLFLILLKKEKVTGALNNECTIYRLIVP
jgi:hypothetical protein